MSLQCLVTRAVARGATSALLSPLGLIDAHAKVFACAAGTRSRHMIDAFIDVGVDVNTVSVWVHGPVRHASSSGGPRDPGKCGADSSLRWTHENDQTEFMEVILRRRPRGVLCLTAPQSF